MNPRYKNIAFLDFESYYDTKSGYSLAKMPTINYCRDPRFKSFGCSVGWNKEPMVYLTHEEFIEWSESVDWTTTAVCAHNCQFDACVLTQHYNIFAAYYICTQAVSQALLPIDSVALKKVAPLLGLGEKTNALVDGATQASTGMADYANNDNLLAKGIFEILYPMLSQDEQDLIHLHVRQAVEPSLILDVDVLTQVRDDAAASRLAAIEASGYSDKELTSNVKFAKIIKDLGIQAPTKLSETTGEETEAFAKGDDEFIEFMLRYPEHKHIWDGRLAAKSNINVSRAEKFLSIAALNPLVPMPLKYCGAHTGRSSGCLVAETQVIVYNEFHGIETKNIIDVLLDDLVWDGEEFVQHEGVVFKGYQSVITHDNVTGTEDHVVFTNSGETSLFEAMRRGAAIQDAAPPTVHTADAIVRGYT